MTYSRATGSENYRLLSVAGSGVLSVTEESVPILKGKKPASNPVLTTGLPVTENCRFRSVAGSGTVVLLVTRICCSHPYWQGTIFKFKADNRFNS